MTFEHKLLIGLDEIKALVFQCNECNSRTVVAPESIERPFTKCPQGHAWDWNAPTEFKEFSSPFLAFFYAVKRLRDPVREKSSGFRLLLELEEPKK